MFTPAAPAKPQPFSVAHIGQPSEVELWPDNWQTFGLFRLVCDQWIVGAGGIVALNLCAVYPVLDQAGLTGDDWLRAVSDIRHMAETAAEVIRNSGD